MTTFLKKYWRDILLIVIAITMIVIVFRSCEKKGYKQAIVIPTPIEKNLLQRIEKKLDSVNNKKLNTTIINKNYENKREIYNMLPDSLLHSYNVELAKELLPDSLPKRHIPRRK